MTNSFTGVLTGKGLSYGVSLARKEAPGYGLVFFTARMLESRKIDWNGKRVVISGAGNVAIYAAEKAMSLRANVVAMSDSNGYIVDEQGVDRDAIKRIKEVGGAELKNIWRRGLRLDSPGLRFRSGGGSRELS